MYIYLMNEARTHSIGNNFRIRLSRIFSEDEQSAILFVGDIDDTDCEILVDFIKSYTTTIFPVSYDDIIINYQLDSCKGEKGSVYKKAAPCNGLGKDMQGLLPPANEVWGKVMFLYLCVILVAFWVTNPCRITRKEFLMKQTKMYVCTLEEFILVDIWIHCCASWNWICIGML